jgi:hypothetical protein
MAFLSSFSACTYGKNLNQKRQFFGKNGQSINKFITSTPDDKQLNTNWSTFVARRGLQVLLLHGQHNTAEDTSPDQLESKPAKPLASPPDCQTSRPLCPGANLMNQNVGRKVYGQDFILPYSAKVNYIISDYFMVNWMNFLDFKNPQK